MATLVLVLLLGSSSAPHASGNGLVAAFAFDEGTGTTVADASGLGNGGVTKSTSWSAAGRYGSALSFNGTSSWVSVPDSASLDLTTAVTVEAWVKPVSAQGTGWKTVAIKEQTGDLVYGLYANSDTSRPAGIVYRSGAEADTRGTGALPVNTWTHLATTWDGATLRLYVNGTQVSSRLASGAMPISSGPLRIGGNGVWGEWFSGLIDDVRIYSRALPAAEISTDMTTPVSSSPAPDTAPPSTPTGLATTGATSNSIAASWTASTDNVGVAGYNAYRDGAKVGTATGTSYSFGGLTCGTSYQLGVEAYDAAGNTSGRSTLTASTTACTDTTPPSTPPSFAAGTITSTSVATSWTASTDNVGVAGYDLFRDSVKIDTTTARSYSFTGLTCAKSYTFGVEAFDAAGNHSARALLAASTAACDTTAPQVAVTAPSGGSTVSGTVQLAASASDAGGIASVQFTLDGASIGAPVTSSPYTLAWDSHGAQNGAHTIGAVARDTSGNTGTSAAVSITVQNNFDTTNARKRVDIGPGYTDASLRDVVRTANDRVYVFVADDTPQRKGIGPGVIHAYRANQTGIPTSFGEVDAAHRPSGTGNTHVVCSPDVRLDSSGVAHMVYTDETNATLWYQTFSTLTDTWGPRQSLATGVDVPTSAIKREASNALVLDANNVPHVAYAGGSVVQYRNRLGGSWSTPVTVSTGGKPIHVALAAAADGTLSLAWLQEGAAPTIRYAQRSPGGVWGAPETVAATDVLDDSNSDQGPSVALSATGEPYVLYVSAKPASAVRVRSRAGGAWTLDGPSADLYTHTPQIYMRGNDAYAFLGHDSQIRFGYAYHLAGQAWSAYTPLTTTSEGTFDGSASVRWDPLHEPNAAVIDSTFFDEDSLDNSTFYAEAYYMAVLPSASTGGDTTSPTVSVTAPTSGATVSGTTSVTASASDDVGVVGVQFRLDGALLGAEDTSTPYSVSWDTSTVANGTHTLTAVARDAAGHSTTSAVVTVSVANSTTPPGQPVTVGDTQIEPGADSVAPGKSEAYQLTATAATTLTRLVVYLDAGTPPSTLVAGIYTNANGHPGTLLAQGSLASPRASAWNTIAIPQATITAGTVYWIALLSPAGTSTLRFRDRCCSGTGGVTEVSSQLALTTLPPTWTTGIAYRDGPMSAYGSSS